jgi:O-antigen ligase
VPIVVLSIFIFTKTDFYKLYVYGKIFDSSKTLTTGNFSKVDRIITGQVAVDSGLDNPFFGVGPANYALHYDYYNHYKKIVINRNDYFDTLARRKNIRSIPNNVYLEVLSEYGVIAFVLFIVLLISRVINSYSLKEDALTGGMLALLVSLNAFPSFIMLFIWVFISIPFALEWNTKKDKTSRTKVILDN